MLVDQITRWGEAHAGPPATDSELAACESALGHALPEGLRRLLQEANGIEGAHGLGLVWPAARVASDNVRFRTDHVYAELYMPFDGLVFFSDGGNGDQFGLSLHGNNEVYVWDHEDDSRTWVAQTVPRFLEDWMTGRLTI